MVAIFEKQKEDTNTDIKKEYPIDIGVFDDDKHTEENIQIETADELKIALLDISVEAWRFGKLFDRLLFKLDAGEQNRYANQFRYFQKKIDNSLGQAQLKVVNVEGHPYDPGMAATPLNMNEFEPQDELFVDQMLEPIIMGPNGVVKTGTVTLRKVIS